MQGWPDLSLLRRPSTPGGVVYLVVLLSVVSGIVLAVAHLWRVGITVMGLSFTLAFVTRAVLPESQAGMLRVRRRLVDLLSLGVCAALLLLLAAIVPGP